MGGRFLLKGMSDGGLITPVKDECDHQGDSERHQAQNLRVRLLKCVEMRDCIFGD